MACKIGVRLPVLVRLKYDTDPFLFNGAFPMRLRVFAVTLTGMLLLPALALADKDEKLTAAALAAQLDKHVAAKWTASKVTPSAQADDSEWVRRAYLDLTGRIPDILAARDFIENPDKNKRAKLIEKLLADDRYPLHWATVWRVWWMPATAAEAQNQYLSLGFENWLQGQLKKNASYDSMVKDVLTATQGGYNGPYTFYTAAQNRPENIASSVSRMFLGVKLECAQCHNHPFSKWKRQQFWEFAAFFTEVGVRPIDPTNPRVRPQPYTPGEIDIPGTDKKVKAKFPDGKEMKEERGTRAILADWMTAKDNPYFARAAVNRVWEYLLGTGLVEPVDEESEENLPSHPEIMDLLAKQFAAHDYDLKYLISTITLTRAYQLSSKQTNSAQADARLFARMRVRGLSPEQLYDSLAVATGQKDEDNSALDAYGRFRNFNVNSPRYDFLRRFPNQDKRTEQQTSILQALFLMNGKLVADATSLEHNKNLEILAQAKSVRTSRRIEQLYLVALARKPTANESARLVKYVDSGGPKKDSARALCDVFWALLNSSEFCSNH